jgi:alkylation response protein AidB-like acyl-CoA dehydrogenase
MSLVLTEEQEAIRQTAASFARERMPVAHFRALRDRDDDVGFSREAWKELAALGFAGMLVPEAYGGAGLGLAEIGLAFEELGRTLAPTPLLSSSVLAASALALGGSDAAKRAWLPSIASGEAVVAFAHDEGTRHARTRIATRADRTAGGHRLSGTKAFVLDGHVASAFVVTARTRGRIDDREGVATFLVPADARGVTATRLSVVDSRNAAEVRFDDVEVPEGAAIGEPGSCADLVERVLDRGTVALASEMLGGAQEAFARTIAYLKERRQFGVPIGSFQALKHRAAHMFCEIELAKSIVLESLRALDAEASDATLLASVAKARLSDTFLLVANEAIQMHGGIGVTDEHDIGLFLKRARVSELTFGDAAFHRDRFARLRGY